MDKKNSLVNLGCRLNIYEGEIIKNHLKNSNLNNVTVINSCAVTAVAEKKVAYEIRKAKRNNPENKIIVTGCAAQINPQKYDAINESYLDIFENTFPANLNLVDACMDPFLSMSSKTAE